MSSAAADAEIIVTNLLRRIASFWVSHSDALYLLYEVTKRVYFIGNERMLIAHDSNRLRFS